MERMTTKQFRKYLLDTIRDAEPKDLERIGHAAIGPDLRFVPFADGFEISDDTTPTDTIEDKYPRSDWRYEVNNGDTKLGYLEWLAHKIEMNRTKP